MPPARVLLLGIDAPSVSWITDWVAAGALPTLGSLMARGLVGDTLSLDGFFVGSTWPSLYTGVTPARHGIHSLAQLAPRTYDYRRHRPDDFAQREPFWNHLSRAGRRVAILDVPLSAVSPDLNGIQVVEWGSHDPSFGLTTWPPALAGEIRSRFGSHPVSGSCDADRRAAQAFAGLARALVEGVRKKAELTVHYLDQGGWDLFAQVFTESHCAGHQCWHLLDPRHPAFDPGTAAAAGHPIRRVYAAIDRAIGDVIARAGDGTLVVILAAHGMSHRFGAQFLLPEILVRLEVAARPSPRAPAPPGRLAVIEGALAWGWRYTPERIRGPVRAVRARLRERAGEDSLPDHPVDPRKSLCFLVDNGLAVGGIRLNLAGREPHGLLAPGAEADAFCAALTRDLLDIVDLRTGRPIVRRVMRTSHLFQGDHLDALPDLLVEWSDEIPLGTSTLTAAGSVVTLQSDRIGTVSGANSYCRTGDHRPQGFFIAAGPGIEPGRLAQPVSILDFAPTFLALLDAEAPPGDGTPIPALLRTKPAS